MNDPTAQPQPTPNRRRQGRPNGRQKAYASENDMGVIDAPQYNMSPATPQKDNPGSSAGRDPRTTGSKQRQKNKGNKNNAASTSPEPDSHHHRSTPRQPNSTKGLQQAAFAGATFHASPAPDALPMPSFFSKMANGSPASKETSRPLQQPSPPNTVNEAPTPQRGGGGVSGSDSPLDFMFKAHREERERHRHGSGPTGPSASTPPAHSPYGAGSQKAATVPHSRPVYMRHVSSGVLDDEESRGHFGQPMGPAFSTPYQDRIKAARPSNNSPRPSGAGNSQMQPQNMTEDPSEALKRFLFSGNKAASTESNAQPPQAGITNQSSASRTYDGTSGGHNESIQDMEDSLRKILKIEPNTTAPPTERRLFMR